MRQVERELSDLGPRDEVALYTIADRLQPVVVAADADAFLASVAA
jgi:hypothetical protein